jgi:D-cysteine desulfhydrase
MIAPRLPRIAIGKWPTPVSRLNAVSDALGAEVWVKREDGSGTWGGNKVRKLEYILADARDKGRSTLVAYGAGSSSWAAATAWHGYEQGFGVVLGLGGHVPDAYSDLYRRLGTTIVSLPSYSLVPAAAVAARARAGRSGVATLPAGGSGSLGDMGSIAAGAEIATAVTNGGLPHPTHVFVAAGTGGTAAGLAVGLGAGGIACPVVAVRVTPRPLGTRGLVHRHVRSLVRALGPERIVPAPVIGSGDFFGGGYGRQTPATQAAIELAARDGLEPDPTYGAKAFAALIATARSGARGPLLYVHTSPGPPPPSAE